MKTAKKKPIIIKKKNKSKKMQKQKAKEDLFSFDDEKIIGISNEEEKDTNKRQKNKKQEKNKKKILSKKEIEKKSKNKKQSKEQEQNNLQNKQQNKSKNQIEKPKQNTKKSKPINRKKVKKVKKPKQVIELTEEEIEQKLIKRRKTIKIIKILSIICLFITLIVVTMFSPLFNIKDIIIIGNEKVKQKEIVSLSEIQIGENTYKVSKNKVKEKIKQNSYIQDVSIKRILPSQIQISIVEREATFMIELGGNYLYIDNQGYILELSSEKLDLPILQGIQTQTENLKEGSRLDNNDLKKMNTVLRIMEIAQGNEIGNLITKIDIENEKNYKILFESEGKTAYLGDSTNLNTKILTIKAILENVKGLSGEIFVNMDLNNDYPIFRQSV